MLCMNKAAGSDKESRQQNWEALGSEHWKAATRQSCHNQPGLGWGTPERHLPLTSHFWGAACQQWEGPEPQVGGICRTAGSHSTLLHSLRFL